MKPTQSEYNHLKISVPSEFKSIFSHVYYAEKNSKFAIIKTLIPIYQTIFLIFFTTI